MTLNPVIPYADAAYRGSTTLRVLAVGVAITAMLIGLWIGRRRGR